jgi:hypothetical protein
VIPRYVSITKAILKLLRPDHAKRGHQCNGSNKSQKVHTVYTQRKHKSRSDASLMLSIKFRSLDALQL